MAKRIHFGVVNVGYGNQGKTTHEVADILEGKYGVIERFVKDNEKGIRLLMGQQTKRHVQSLAGGRSPSMQPALDQIKRLFKSYILAKSLDGRVRGVPTAASLRGVNHRLKHPYAKGNPARPSFFDTGLYVSAFKAWIE